MSNYQITTLKNVFLIEKFNEVTKRFLILAEHKTLESAKLDLKMWRAA